MKLFSHVCAAVSVAILVTALAAGLRVSAAQTTLFALKTEKTDDGLAVSVTTDTTKGVGGLHLIVRFYPDQWQMYDGSISTAVSGADVGSDNEEGTVWFLWDTTTSEELPSKLMTFRLDQIGTPGHPEDLYIEVVEYYDNTPAMNDLAYTFTITPAASEGAQSSADKTPSVNTAAFIAAAIAAVAAVCGMIWFAMRRKRAAAASTVSDTENTP